MSILAKDIPVLKSCYCDKYMLLEIKPKYHYIGRAKTKDVEGYYYTVLVPHLDKYVNVNILILSQKILDLSTHKGQLPEVSFKNLELTYFLPNYKRTLEIMGIADEVELFIDIRSNYHNEIVSEEVKQKEEFRQEKESVLTRLTRSKFTD